MGLLHLMHLCLFGSHGSSLSSQRSPAAHKIKVLRLSFAVAVVVVVLSGVALLSRFFWGGLRGGDSDSDSAVVVAASVAPMTGIDPPELMDSNSAPSS